MLFSYLSLYTRHVIHVASGAWAAPSVCMLKFPLPQGRVAVLGLRVNVRT